MPLLAGRVGLHQTGGEQGRIHWLRTLRNKGAQPLQRRHIQYVRQPLDAASFHLIVLDASGSMRRNGRLNLAKSYAARLVDDATRAGDQVAILALSGQGVQLLKAPGPARRSAIARIQTLGSGGGTPIASCLQQAQQVLHSYRLRHGSGRRTLWLLTDGRSTERPAAPAAADHIVVVNFDDPRNPLGRCAAWAAGWGAEYRDPV